VSGPACPANILPGSARSRAIAGWLAVAAGAGLAAYLALKHAPWTTRLLVFPPVWVGLLGVLQAAHGT